MIPGAYAALTALKHQRMRVPWPYRDRLAYKAHVEQGTIRGLIAKAPVHEISPYFLGLHAIQHTVNVGRVVEYALDPQLAEGRVNEAIGTPSDLPIIVTFKGYHYIHDGHHRLTRAKLAEEGCFARFVDLDAAAGSASTKVQTLVFSKKKFTRKKAVAWAKTHDFKSSDVDETDVSYRLRQRDPGRFQPGSFRTVKLTAGVLAVIGKLR